MTALCGISGELTGKGVVITTSGYTYDKDLLEKYAQEHGYVCPTTGEAYDPKENVLELRAAPGAGNLKPRTTQTASVPGLLSLLQNEWDAVMLEAHKLRKENYSTREELSQTLYMHDAACRVVARLIKERDEAKAALSSLKAGAGGHSSAGAAPSQAMEVENNAGNASGKRERGEEDGEEAKKVSKSGITKEVVEKIMTTAKALAKTRKKRPLPDGLTSLESLSSSYELVGKFPLHTTSGPTRGITCMDTDGESGNLVTGGADGKFKVFDMSARKASSDAVKAHGKAITSIKLLSSLDLVGTCSVDKTCKVWKNAGESKTKAYSYDLLYTLSDHSSEVVGVDKQACGDYLVTFGKDGSWIFYDLLEGLKLSTTTAGEGVGFTCGTFHPDGILLGTGTSAESGGDVLIWDVKTQKSVAKMQGHKGSVSSLCFSENGYYMATASSDHSEGCKIWDLRKLANVHTIDLAPLVSGKKFGKKPPKVVATFDSSGAYLGVGVGGAVQVYGSKQSWSPLLGQEGGFQDVPSTTTKGVSCLNFGTLAKNLYVGSNSDHNLRIYGC
ncbi:WD repeat domain-containing protein [Chloropicon primus]|uniref:Pre-mRNA-processing factor 19 n=1 Tax=Chloropicon primus TaxID=1764295 RepID=A0A5B8MD76_9CHLO|nr:WD repeat domain-containing protein [Chloropicon primus]UPQ97577.1 WD repeat domain-containing protein [Chloropicon primus]|eukprot:QDZ18367.1 WD repeat domain-containing protein [Chloropicon primus]